MKKKILVIIPAYNTSQQIGEVLDTLNSKNVIVVNDGSSDDTGTIAEKLGVNVITHKLNYGLGTAIKTGVKFAIKNQYTHAVTLDSDGQHDPKYLDQFFDLLHSFDLVIGNRFHSLYTIPHQKIASNFFAHLIIERAFSIHIKDVSCGYRGFRINKSILNYRSQGFDFVYEQIIALSRKHTKIGYVNIPAIYRIDSLLCTKVSELKDLLSSVIRLSHVTKNNEFLSSLIELEEKVNRREELTISIAPYSFYGFFMHEVNSYIFQTNTVDAIKYYEQFRC